MKKATIYFLLFGMNLLPVRGQIISEWNQGGGVVTHMGENTISEDDYAAEGIFSDWNDTVRDFTAYDGNTELDSLPAERKEYRQVKTLRGMTLNLPEIIDENGIDVYLLTTEGITIYLALDEPVYYQEPDDEIVKWIRYYAYEKRKYTATVFRRYKDWEPRIKAYFRSQGVPEELAELCLIESGCTYKALSPAGAYGMWQIMPDTGRSYGMTITGYRDDREDPVLSTQAAARILGSNYRRVGEWTLAAAAYNCGAGRVQKEMNRGRNTWESMKGTLPKETSQYIPALIAMHYVWTYKEKLKLD